LTGYDDAKKTRFSREKRVFVVLRAMDLNHLDTRPLSIAIDSVRVE
jgi:hypothetical protein